MVEEVVAAMDIYVVKGADATTSWPPGRVDYQLTGLYDMTSRRLILVTQRV